MKGLQHYIQKELTNLLNRADQSTFLSRSKGPPTSRPFSLQFCRHSASLTSNTLRSLTNRTVATSQLQRTRPKTAMLRPKPSKSKQFFMVDLIKAEQSLNRIMRNQYPTKASFLDPKTQNKKKSPSLKHRLKCSSKKRPTTTNQQLPLQLATTQLQSFQSYLESKMSLNPRTPRPFSHLPSSTPLK